MKHHSNLLVAAIFLFINEHYRKANKRKKRKKNKPKQMGNEINHPHLPSFFTLKEINFTLLEPVNSFLVV